MNIDDRTRGFLNTTEGTVFAEYAALIRRLRAPDGCPWDRKQTLQTLRRFLIEESFEVLAAINDYQQYQDWRRHDPDPPDHATEESRKAESVLHDIGEELGDVVLVVMLLADALVLSGGPAFDQVLRENGNKLIRRHPHVFGATSADNEDEVAANWKRIKEETEQKPTGVTNVSSGLPPLERAYEIQKKAGAQGFDWPDTQPVFEKLHEETQELKDELEEAERRNAPLRDNPAIEAELGDVLFTVVNLARKLNADPSVALAGANERFLTRFRHIEETLSAEGRTVSNTSLEALDRLWEAAKRL